MKNIIYTVLFFTNCAIHNLVAIRPGDKCNSQFGEGTCTQITQCKLLARIKQLGHIPTMCGADSSGPIVCCPKYSHNLQLAKPNYQKPREPEIKRPDLNFDHEMQSDQSFSNQRNSYFYNTQEHIQKNNYNTRRFNEWDSDDTYLTSSSTYSWMNNGQRKTTHEKFDFSTNGYSSYNDNFKPVRRPSESNSYEINDLRPHTSKPNSFSSNSQQSWNNGNNRPFSSNEWSDERPSFNKPSNRPFNSFERPDSFSSVYNYRPTTSQPNEEEEEEDKPPIWGVVRDKSTTSRPTSSFSSGWSRPKRISQRKCDEYSEILSNNLSPLPLPLLQNANDAVQKCGPEKPVALIVGGSDTTLGEFPHMAAIGFQSRGNTNWNCGGTLISDEYVLTAAHCTFSNEGQPVRVRLGDWNLQRNDETQAVDYRISRIIVHPQYKKTKKYNDIALLQLATKVQFKDTIRPACLFDQDDIPVNKSTATGWGRLETAGVKSSILKKVELTLINTRECNELYQKEGTDSSLNNGITSSMICAGEMSGGYDTCLGDSGGPLQFKRTENKCMYNIVGVTSFGKSMCGLARSPGVYTRVSSFLSWIESVVWP